jgi:uncharacterized membrane protein YdjX (TVP38/TMEM64 family)
MLGIILIIFIAKKFYTLAEDNNENKWLYAIVSVVVYYGSTFLAGLLVGVICLIFGYDIENFGKVELTFIAIIFGLIMVYVFYEVLDKKWFNKKNEVVDDIDQIGVKELD